MRSIHSLWWVKGPILIPSKRTISEPQCLFTSEVERYLNSETKTVIIKAFWFPIFLLPLWKNRTTVPSKDSFHSFLILWVDMLTKHEQELEYNTSSEQADIFFIFLWYAISEKKSQQAFHFIYFFLEGEPIWSQVAENRILSKHYV